MFEDWEARWRGTPDHHLSLRDHVGPFPVGPEGYHAEEAGRPSGVPGRRGCSSGHGREHVNRAHRFPMSDGNILISSGLGDTLP